MNYIDPIHYLSQKDSKLASIIQSIGKYSRKPNVNPFESLIQSIISQQLSGKAAKAIYIRFIDYYNKIFPTPQQIISTPNEILRVQIGLSFKKIEYIKELSSRISNGKLDFASLINNSDEEIIAELIKVKGIGRWTAEMFLIFCLEREDVIPLGDLGVRKAMQKLYNLPQLPDPSSILAISLPWRPYRSIATWYLWKSISTVDSIG
jgi:DNA-3-methyladenine glycosylase II